MRKRRSHRQSEAVPHVAQWRVPHSPDLMSSNLSLADQIAATGHALTANELSKMLAVSHVTIFKQAKAGRIPSFRIGTCVRFDPKTTADWLRSR
jgi:excisionase family DNA binding protein